MYVRVAWLVPYQLTGRAFCLHCCCLFCCTPCSMEDGRLVYVREAKQEQLMLMHLLVVALDLEGWRMAPQQFEMLRRELKTTPADVVNRCGASSPLRELTVELQWAACLSPPYAMCYS